MQSTSTGDVAEPHLLHQVAVEPSRLLLLLEDLRSLDKQNWELLNQISRH